MERSEYAAEPGEEDKVFQNGASSQPPIDVIALSSQPPYHVTQLPKILHTTKASDRL